MSTLDTLRIAVEIALGGGLLLALVNRYFKRVDDRREDTGAARVAQIQSDEHQTQRLYDRVHQLETEARATAAERVRELKDFHRVEGELAARIKELEAKDAGLADDLSECRAVIENRDAQIAAQNELMRQLEDENREQRLQRHTVEQALRGLERASDGLKRILVVDDYAEIAIMMQHLLRLSGFHVAVCHSGQEALHSHETARILGSDFDLILMDFQMPHMTGSQAAQEIRQRGDWDVKIMFLTAHAGELFEKDTYGVATDILKPDIAALNLSGILIKPIDREVLCSEVRKSLGIT